MGSDERLGRKLAVNEERGSGNAQQEWADVEIDLDCLERLAPFAIPATPLVKTAIGHAKAESEPWLYNHVIRSWLFAMHVARHRSLTCDIEVLAVGSVLHDLGLTERDSALERFEVDGANAARRLIEQVAPEMDSRRRQLVWDCIALHSTGSIARHKEVEVTLVNAGIALDYSGAGLDHLSAEAHAAILEAFPRLNMKDRFCSCLCALAAKKPASTYGTWVADFGHRFVEGYAPPSSVDTLFNSPWSE